jgi:phosphoribosylanthranilate isomerase
MNPLPFQIKICGVTTAEDAKIAVDAGADAIGLNFYPRSKRFVTREQARRITAAIPAGVTKVGVFVNASLEEITSAIFAASLGLVQLHGDEPPEFLAQIRLPVMRALRWGANGQREIDEYLANCAAQHCALIALLLDSQISGQFGGTGETADWDAISTWRERRRFDIPLVLAGGLTPGNVAAAIAAVRPDAVDTASGVETSPGRKDRGLIRAFVEAARGAFDALKSSPS